jgi:hypothetical protein
LAGSFLGRAAAAVGRAALQVSGVGLRLLGGANERSESQYRSRWVDPAGSFPSKQSGSLHLARWLKRAGLLRCCCSAAAPPAAAPAAPNSAARVLTRPTALELSRVRLHTSLIRLHGAAVLAPSSPSTCPYRFRVRGGQTKQWAFGEGRPSAAGLGEQCC